MSGPELSGTQVTVDDWALSPEVAEILRAEAFAGLKSLPRRGAEIGGFLTVQADSGNEVGVDGIELVPTEHLYGPLYRLSPSDLDLFRARVDLACASGKRKPVGYFRSCTRDQFRVDAEDLKAIHEALPGAKVIFLVKPFQSSDAIVRVYSSDDGESSAYLSEFPLRMNYSAAPDPIAAAPAAPAPASAEYHSSYHSPLHSSSALDQTLPPSRAMPQRWDRRAWLPYAILAAAAVFFTWAYLQGRAVPLRASLGMRVETQAHGLRVTWDRQLPVLQSAVAATMRIDDQGVPHQGEPREIKLDHSQIATGSLVYVTDANDVTFRMQVEGPGGRRLSESVRVISGPVSSGGASSEGTRSEDTSKENRAQRVETPRAPEVRAEAALPPSRLAPPPLALPEGKSKPKVAQRVGDGQEETDPILPTVMRAWPSSPRGTGPYWPAQPIRRITPDFQSSLVQETSVVEVEVKIDDKGRVSEARQIGKDPKMDSQLPKRALEASRHWIFKPATSQGRNVASAYRIVYRISPSGK
jgi:hypothetical protein